MFRERVATAILLLPVVLWAIADGRWLYLAGVGFALGVAVLEWRRLFQTAALRPSGPVMLGGILALALTRYLYGFRYVDGVLALCCLSAMTWHLVDYERGAEHSGTDLAVTLAGILYVGWIGSYLISLRTLPDGLWWLLTALPSVWLADSAAYSVGRRFGRHKLSPRLSPKKTWEGYLAGVAGGGAGGAILAWAWQFASGPGSTVTPARGLVIGLIIATLAVLGDLGISMIKREMRVKDTGTFIPGHGGALDRIDSWLWAGVLGYYAVLLLVP
jgi:phosphatidate cytidylyltransferase